MSNMVAMAFQLAPRPNKPTRCGRRPRADGRKSSKWRDIERAIDARALFAQADIITGEVDRAGKLRLRALALANAVGYGYGVRSTDEWPPECALFSDIEQLHLQFMFGFYSAVRDEANRPRPRREMRPAGVRCETPYFWISQDRYGLSITGTGNQGVSGVIRLTRGTFRAIFAAARQSPVSLTEDLQRDPWASAEPAPQLLRDDLVNVHTDGKGFACGVSDTLGELFLDVCHPANGTVYLGTVATEQTQLDGLLALEPLVAAIYLERESPQYREIAWARAASIRNSAKEPCFLPASGICPVCENDATAFFGRVEPHTAITRCPICDSLWRESRPPLLRGA